MKLLIPRPLVITAEAVAKLAALPPAPRTFMRDPVMLEFLGLPGTGKLLESGLEQALMDKLQAICRMGLNPDMILGTQDTARAFQCLQHRAQVI